MKNIEYFIIGIVVCAITAVILEIFTPSVNWTDAYFGVFGVVLILFGAGTFWQSSEFLEASIALIVVGIIAFIYGVDGNFGFFGEVFDDLVLRKGYN